MALKTQMIGILSKFCNKTSKSATSSRRKLNFKNGLNLKGNDLRPRELLAAAAAGAVSKGHQPGVPAGKGRISRTTPPLQFGWYEVHKEGNKVTSKSHLKSGLADQAGHFGRLSW